MKSYFENKVNEFKNVKFQVRKDEHYKSVILSKQGLNKDGLEIQAGVYMNPLDWNELRSIAAGYGIGMKDLVRIVLEDFLEKYLKSDVLFNRFGI